MIYFDNAATGGFKPDCVQEAVAASLKNCANAGRSGHALSLACAERVYAVRSLLCKFFGASSPDNVVFTPNCTAALNYAILGGISFGDRVVSTVAEHNSVLRPLHYLKERGTDIVLMPLTKEGDIDVQAIVAAAQTGAKAVVLTLASNVTGTSPDIAYIRAHIPCNVLLICDGAQACGHIDINVEELGIDALCVSGHKGMLGMQGSGALILSQRFSPRPIIFGGTGSNAINAAMPQFYPDRLEAGTLSYPSVVSLGEGALYLTNHLAENCKRRVYLADMLARKLSAIKGVKLYSKSNKFGIVAFSLKNMQSEMVANKLSEDFSICVRGGMHCAPLMHKALKSEGLVRASLSAFNNEREVEYFAKAVASLCQNNI